MWDYVGYGVAGVVGLALALKFFRKPEEEQEEKKGGVRPFMHQLHMTRSSDIPPRQGERIEDLSAVEAAVVVNRNVIRDWWDDTFKGFVGGNAAGNQQYVEEWISRLKSRLCQHALDRHGDRHRPEEGLQVAIVELDIKSTPFMGKGMQEYVAMGQAVVVRVK